jgi:hypothetical protein
LSWVGELTARVCHAHLIIFILWFGDRRHRVDLFLTRSSGSDDESHWLSGRPSGGTRRPLYPRRRTWHSPNFWRVPQALGDAESAESPREIPPYVREIVNTTINGHNNGFVQMVETSRDMRKPITRTLLDAIDHFKAWEKDFSTALNLLNQYARVRIAPGTVLEIRVAAGHARMRYSKLNFNDSHVNLRSFSETDDLETNARTRYVRRDNTLVLVQTMKDFTKIEQRDFMMVIRTALEQIDSAGVSHALRRVDIRWSSRSIRPQCRSRPPCGSF